MQAGAAVLAGTATTGQATLVTAAAGGIASGVGESVNQLTDGKPGVNKNAILGAGGGLGGGVGQQVTGTIGATVSGPIIGAVEGAGAVVGAAASAASTAALEAVKTDLSNIYTVSPE